MEEIAVKTAFVSLFKQYHMQMCSLIKAKCGCRKILWCESYSLGWVAYSLLIISIFVLHQAIVFS